MPDRNTSIRLFVLGLFVAGATAVVAQRPDKVRLPEVATPVQEGEPDRLRRIQGPLFAGEAMTEARGSEIAAQERDVFVDFYSCTPLSPRCTTLLVQTPAGELFQYVLSSRPCGGDNLRRLQGRPCYGGYSIIYRVRQANELWVGGDGHISTLSNEVQLRTNGQWYTEFSVSATEYSSGRTVISDGYTQGMSYVMLDADGNVLASDTDAVSANPAGEPATPSVTELCEATKQEVLTNGAANKALGDLVCKALPKSVTSTLEGSIEPLGIGGSTGTAVTFDVDWCGGTATVYGKQKEAAAAETYSDCLKNPGAYWPEYFDSEPKEFEPGDMPEFDSPFVPASVEPEAGAVCPATMTVYVTVEMGDGVFCSGNVRYSCETTTDGECECTDPQLAGSMVCTQPQ